MAILDDSEFFQPPENSKDSGKPINLGTNEDPQMSSLGQFVAGGYVGLRKNPFVNIALAPLSHAMGLTDDELADLESRLADSTPAKVGSVMGEFLPDIYGVSKIYGVGRGLGKYMLVNSGTEVGKKVAAREAAGAAASGAGAIVRKPAAERAAELIGGNIGVGGYFGGQEFAETGDAKEALKTAGIVTALGLTMEGGIIGAAKIVSRGARNVDTSQLRRLHEERGIPAMQSERKALLVGGKIMKREGDAIKEVKIKGARELSQKKRLVAAERENVQSLIQEGGLVDAELKISHIKGKTAQHISLVQTRIKSLQEDLSAGRGSQLIGKNMDKAASKLAKSEDQLDSLFAKLVDQAGRQMAGLERKTLKQRAGAKALKKIESAAISAITYMMEHPYSPGGVQLFMARLGMKVMNSPDSYFGKLGITFGKVAHRLEVAVNESTMHDSLLQDYTKKFADRMLKTIGKTEKDERLALKAGRSVFLDVQHAWEKGRDEGVRSLMRSSKRSMRDANDAIKVFHEMEEMGKSRYILAESMGARKRYTPEDLEKLGVMSYMRHGISDIPEDDIRRLFQGHVTSGKLEMLIKEMKEGGLPSFTSGDFARVNKGTLKELLDKGLPYEPNMFINFYNQVAGANRRVQLGRVLGYNGELTPRILDAIQLEAATKARAVGKQVGKAKGMLPDDGGLGARTIANDIISVVSGDKYYPNAMRQLTRIPLNLQVARKLPLAVIPNLSQPVLTQLAFGTRATLAGVVRTIKMQAGRPDTSHDVIIKATGIHESAIIGGIQRAFRSRRTTPDSSQTDKFVEGFGNVTDKLARWALDGTQFSRVERWNRYHAGATGEYVFHDILSKAMAGKLRGNSLDIARRRMQSMGVDLPYMLGQIKKHGKQWMDIKDGEYTEILYNAVFKAAQKTQFIPSPLTRPVWWDHPVGKMAFQFKTFALGQGKLMRDAVLTEAAHGNMLPLAYTMSFAPLAGEVVSTVKHAVKGQSRDESGWDRYMEDFFSMGGFGVVGDAARASSLGMLPEFGLGPSATDAFMFMQSVFNMNPQQVMKAELRQPWFQAARAVTVGGAVAGYGAYKGVGAGVDLLFNESGEPISKRYDDYNNYEDSIERGRATVDMGTFRLQNREQGR